MIEKILQKINNGFPNELIKKGKYMVFFLLS